MIPGILGREVRETIEDYLRTSYRISTPSFAKALDEFIKQGEAFKGAYLSIQLPFIKSEKKEQPFPAIPLLYTPYLHQERAFERLTADPPKPTIVATGTGSGKTEAFLLPILDYCRQVAGQPGVKAILIYPMNALASDQAKRIAQIIHENPSLRGKITAGLYIGGLEATPSKRMSESSIITDRYKMRESPPDLLLTNYKMLDYLLVRPKDKPLWKQNQPDTLRFVVVDELHTFDGAQGTDLACLLRRLKARLQATNLCPIGTSATLGSGTGDELRIYAEQIFDAKFDDEAIITEERRDPGEFLMDSLIKRFNFPDTVPPSDQFESIEDYIGAQYAAWFDSNVTNLEVTTDSWRKQLGAQLHEHVAFTNLIKIIRQDIYSITDVAKKFAQPLEADINSDQLSLRRLESLLSLISYARDPKNEDGKKAKPLLDVRIQLWMRELKRMVISVEEKPKLEWDTDLGRGGHSLQYLPLASCIKCGSAGWATIQRIKTEPLDTSLDSIYKAFFDNKSDYKPEVVYPNPDSTLTEIWKLCTNCLHPYSRRTTECERCQENGNLITVHIPTLKLDRNKRPECPYCQESNQPAIFGAQGASLLSASLGKVFSSHYNTDKKVLTFSDSVQDAAHRAGYFEARTYTFSIRTALLQYLRSMEEGQSLQSVADGLVQFQRNELGDLDFVGTFIAPNMTWMNDYKDLVQSGELPKDSRLTSKVAKRLKWEVFENLGLRARRGRTLENTLSASVFIDPALFNEWVTRVLPELRAKYAGLENLSESKLRQFMTGLIYRLRTSGGVMHSALTKHIETLGKNRYTISDRHIDWMPPCKPQSPRHQFLSSGPVKNFLPLTGTKIGSWVQNWAYLCLLQDDLEPTGFDAALRDIIIEAPSELLKENPTGQHSIWGIEPDALKITTKVRLYSCNSCSYEVSVPEQQEDIWINMPCLKHRCSGKFRVQPNRKIDYYRALYGSGDVCRFVPREHTALLTAEQRETIEKSFMGKDPRPWDPNIVSCTPTLELGIDIGDLSTVFLCSVPPTQANYVQRIGRAGRQNGNSFGFSMALNKPHDLYFFAEPDQMIGGEVQVPGVFLKALGVLRRQMAAYSMDMWIAHSRNPFVPDKLQRVLGAFTSESNKDFPWNWLEYVEINANMLATSFHKLFRDQKNEEILDAANYFFSPEDTGNPQLRKIVIDAIKEKYNTRKDLNNRIKRLDRHIESLDQAPRDENYEKERNKLNDIRRGLKSIRYEISQTDVFNFLSNVGILPNYAFPQSSTTLESTILQSRGQEQKESLSDSFERPGDKAIREFAPGNYFYANGRKVQVDAVRFNKDDVQKWRFCPDCSYHERESEKPAQNCPKCDCTSWGDQGQVLKLLRLSGARSTSLERSSRIDDSRDDRQPEFFTHQTHVIFDDQDIKNAYQAKHAEISFGFEFIKKCQFTFINHGLTSPDAMPILIAGKEKSVASFDLCENCGKAKLPNTKQPSDHEYYCGDRGKDKEARTKVSLYHQFESEAIRLLLPVAEEELDATRAESFCAALLMGLKEFFKGKVDHLRTIIQDAPSPNEEVRRTFIYLYDTVPGGTGHLQDLLKENTIIEKVLTSALTKLQDCCCHKDPSKDGCYRCLFAYRNSFTRGSISRDEAISILEKIVDQGRELELIDNIDSININPLIESKLEEDFVKNLKKWRGAKLITQTRGKNRSYKLTIGEQVWMIECQVLLDRKHGVSAQSKPDFLITPEKGSSGLPVAVFMDGFTYHGNKLAEDTLKRMAILRSGKYHVWSLTWDDLYRENAKRVIDFFPLDSRRKFYKNFDNFIRKFELQFNEFRMQSKSRTAGSLDLLKAYLTDPAPEKWQALAYSHGILNIKESNSTKDLQKYAPSWFVKEWFARPDSQIGVFWIHPEQELRKGCVAVNLTNNGMADPLALRLFVYLDDHKQSDPSFKSHWNEFLRAMNLFQFLHPQTGFFCTSGLEDPEYYEELDTGLPLPTLPSDWIAVLDETAEFSYQRLLGKLADLDTPAPEIGLEITGQKDEILTTAEIAWPNQKVALLHEECWEDRMNCEKEGWNCLYLDKLDASDAQKILKLLK